MPDASPTKWHRAHMTWFFETFLLLPHLPGYRASDGGIGLSLQLLLRGRRAAPCPAEAWHADPARGSEVGDYRAHVDAAMAGLLRDPPAEALPLVELGLQHEEQHQELLLTDILHALSQNPLLPAYDPGWRDPAAAPGFARLIAGPEGVQRDRRRAPASLRQRDPAPQGLARPLPHRRPAGDQWRMARFHRRGRLPHARAVDERGLGRPARPRTGRRRCTGTGGMAPGSSSAWPACSRSTPGRRSGMSPGTRPRPLPAGRNGGCRPRRNGKPPTGCPVSATPRASAGNGPAAPTGPIPASAPGRARSASTTGSSRWGR